MRRDQLEHAIRTACQVIGRPEVIVVGSQSKLLTVNERYRQAAELAASWLRSLKTSS